VSDLAFRTLEGSGGHVERRESHVICFNPARRGPGRLWAAKLAYGTSPRIGLYLISDSASYVLQVRRRAGGCASEGVPLTRPRRKPWAYVKHRTA
jgi:hypothetical protein